MKKKQNPNNILLRNLIENKMASLQIFNVNWCIPVNLFPDVVSPVA